MRAAADGALMVGVRSTSRRRWARLAAVAALLLLTTAGCGDDDADDGGGASGEGDGAGTIVAVDFELSSTTAAAGDEVTFRNDDSVAHTVTADDGGFDTGSVPAGESATFVAPDEPGEIAFHCTIHPSMAGTLTVEG